MPRATNKPCRKYGCPNYQVKGGYCEKHSRDQYYYDDSRGTSNERGYDAKWRKVRARKLRLSPLCEEHRMLGEAVQAVMVHHKDGNSRNNADSNLQSLCFSCHEKTK